MTDEDAQIKRMMERAFEHAFQAQIGHIYSIYIGNKGSVPEQQSYTKKGIENAVAAYRLAIAAVNDWEG